LLDAALPTNQAEVNAAKVTAGDELTNIAETDSQPPHKRSKRRKRVKKPSKIWQSK
jgi:hypothetical protein